jgi:hypothetical protein
MTTKETRSPKQLGPEQHLSGLSGTGRTCVPNFDDDRFGARANCKDERFEAERKGSSKQGKADRKQEH